MNTLVWIFALLFLGLATGVIVGALRAFTRGRTVYDLTAGLLGAVSAGVMLRLLGSPGYRAPLPTLLVGVAAAILATWLTRIATWKGEPFLRSLDDDSLHASDERRTHDVMTTGDATRIFLTSGRLVVPGAKEMATRP